MLEMDITELQNYAKTLGEVAEAMANIN